MELLITAHLRKYFSSSLREREIKMTRTTFSSTLIGTEAEISQSSKSTSCLEKSWTYLKHSKETAN
jgi:hypothetical protein